MDSLAESVFELLSCRSCAVEIDSVQNFLRTPPLRRRSPTWALALKRIDLGSADEIVLVQTPDGVRLITNAAISPPTFDVRMVIFVVGDVRHRVHEAHGAVEVGEFEVALYRLAIFDEFPPVTVPR